VKKLEDQDTFRATLKRYRKAHGISQGELALAAGISRSTLANWEIGLFNLSGVSLERVVKALPGLIEGRATAAQAAMSSYRLWLSDSAVEALATALS
jgi:transcriptional regulator with XRE-family HTH domain